MKGGQNLRMLNMMKLHLKMFNWNIILTSTPER